MSFANLLTDPFSEPFMQRALIEVLMLAALGAISGIYVVLRRLAFFAEALQHTVFPGVVIAFMIGSSLLLGAAIAGLCTAILFSVIIRKRIIDNDAALALLIAGFFALGVVLVSRSRSYHHDLTSLLFGRLLGVDQMQIIETAILAAIVIISLGLIHKELIMRAFDESGSEAIGYKTFWLDVALNVIITIVVIASVRAVGTVLVVAFIVTPAALAKLMASKVVHMMIIAITISLLSAWMGLAISYELSVNRGVDVSPAPMIVLILTALFILTAGVRAMVQARAKRGLSVTQVRASCEHG